MKRAARTVLVGLDACDPTVVRAMAARGEMPVLRRLLEHGARATVHNPYGLFVSTLWETFATGLLPSRHGMANWDEIDVASYEYRGVPQLEERATPFWVTASDAGRRVAVLDVPHARAVAPIDGVELLEWGAHDRHHGLHSWPPTAARELAESFGLHPIFGKDAWTSRTFAPDDYVHREGPVRVVEEEQALLSGLLQGLETKRRLNASLLQEGDWDLLVTVFGESHAIGHQQWHLHDPTHPRFDPTIRDALDGDPLARIYRELDAGVGDVLATVGDDTTVLVLMSHGMGPHYDGTHILDEVLRRIDHVDRGGSLGPGFAGAAKGALGRLPGPVRRRASAVAAPMVRRAARRRPPVPCEPFVTPADRRRQRFFLEPNNFVYGGIRLNLAGREPAGCVAPHEAAAVIAALRDDLLALINVDTGAPAIDAVEPADRWYTESRIEAMPDVFVDWRRTGPIDTVWSPKVGLVHAPYANWRTGDHRPDGLLLVTGPGVRGGTEFSPVDMTDLAPTLLATVGVTAPDLDGRPRPSLVGL